MTAIEQPHPLASDEPRPLELPKPERRFGAFDGLRALAVLLVMIGHAGVQIRGSIGVDVFFVLSGYLITGILLDELGKTGRINFKNFYMRRVLRLFPALVLLITMYLIASAILHAMYPHVPSYNMATAFGDSAIAITYISNWTRAFGNRPNYLGHTWSLSIEEQFYVLWPITVLGLYWLCGRTRKAALICLSAAIAIILYRHWMESFPPFRPINFLDKPVMQKFNRIYNGLDTHGDGLLAGAALAFWTPRIPRWAAILAGWAGILGITWYLAHIYLQTYPGDLHRYLWGTHVQVPEFLIDFGTHAYASIWIFTLLILLGLLNDSEGILARLLGFPPLAWIGVISYGLYLYHFPIIVRLHELRWNTRDIVAMEMVLTFAIATLSFYLLERPCLKLKSRFRSGAPA